MKLVRLWLLGVCGSVLCGSVLCAQQAAPSKASPVLLLGGVQVASDSFTEVGQSLGQRLGVAGVATRRDDGTVGLDHGLFDPVAKQQLLLAGDVLSLRDFDGRQLWSQSALPGVFVGANALDRAVLGRQRIMLPGRDGGVVGIDRASGAVAWSRPEGANRLVTADGELVFVSGPTEHAGELRAYAVQNGARAFAVDLPEAPLAIVPASHGIAAVGAHGAVVFDRSGPRLCELPGPSLMVVASDAGWFTVSESQVTCWDRSGRQRWHLAHAQDAFDKDAVAVDPNGRLLLARYGPISDSGVEVTCHDEATGEIVWRRALPGLGVAHSKYWQHVQVFCAHDVAVVTSQAAGGNFLVALELTDGVERARVQPKR